MELQKKIGISMDRWEAIRNKQRQFVKERDWERFHSPKNLSMALAAEAAELMEIFMWMEKEQIEKLAEKFPEKFEHSKQEIADVFLYCLRIADVLNIDLLAAVEEKMVLNEKKHSIEKALELNKSLM